MRNHTGNLHKETKALPSSKTSYNKVRLRSTLEQRGSSWQSRPSERGARCLLTLALFSQIWLSLSTPVENSSGPDLIGLSSLAPRHKDIAVTWMHVNGENDLYVMKNNSQGYPRRRLSWKLSSAPHLQKSPHQLQFPIEETVQWKLAGNTPDDQQALQMNCTLKYNNLMMPSSG